MSEALGFCQKQEEMMLTWNKAHAPGQLVRANRRSGVTKITKTTGPAYLAKNGAAVVDLAGVAGCELLERIEALEDGKQATTVTE
jgi:hypothetical protein